MSKLLLLLVGVLAFAAADAQEKYPSRPLKIVVPFAPGGSTDIFARLVADKLAVALAQPVVVENRGGASGNIGAEAVAHIRAEREKWGRLVRERNIVVN
jgi:tripartite-type tricarboxylate transporter receptor subunit TctC